MKKYISLLLAVLVTAFTVSAFALAPPPKPDNGWYVVDQANKLSEDQKKALNTKIDGINKNTKNEFGVLLIQTLDGDNIEDFAQNTFRSWGIGKAGLNNGVLLVISVGDRKMRLQTGKGAEGDLPDLRAKDILDNNLKPFLKKGDFAGGINSTISATSSFLESRGGTPVPTKTETSSPPVPLSSSAAEPASSDGSGFGIFLLVLLLGGGLIGFFVNRSIRKEQEAMDARTKLQRKDWLAEAAEAELERKRQREREAREAKTVPHTQISATAIGVGAAAAVAGVAGTAVAISTLSRTEEAKKRKKREEEETRQAEAAARKRREEDEAAAKRRRDEESSSSSYSSYSSSSSSSSYDSGSSSSYDSGGGGFGGGDSGGGGASSDF